MEGMSQSKVNIFFVLSSYALGGMELRGARVARLSASRGHKVHFGCPSGSRLDALLREYNIQRCNVNIRGSLDLFSCLKIVRFLQKSKIDLIMSFTGRDYWMTILAAKLSGIPVVLSRSTAYRFNPLTIPVVKKANNIISVSQGIKEILVSQGIPSRQVKVIYLGVNTSEFSPESTPPQQKSRKEIGLPADKFIIGCLGRSRKGQERLLAADRFIHSYCPDLCYFFAGADIYEHLYPMVEAQPTLKDRVILWDLLPHEEVPKILKAIDLIVHLPEQEPFSNAVLEAMAMEKPLILSRTLGNIEAVEEGKSGFFVEPNDIPALARSVRYLYGSPEMREKLGKSALKRVRELFTEEIMMRQMEEVWTGLCSQ
jgi:glycosyltransferase involved in cell wall biosynthesis